MYALSSALAHTSPSSISQRHLIRFWYRADSHDQLACHQSNVITQLHSLHLTLSMVENLSQRAKVVSINEPTELETALTKNRRNVKF